ncbi:phosphate ABC transporter substrate-binding/OmpA family protein [Celeribacter persicus]|jgi:ABC-type phosphate transport system, periplasmic component|uniref:Phosphate ABC transporter substrate-binding protein (PhoT family) n=1 Tax=Celeribacter persicus TaxID=1651082 RepID=A0A2T5HDU9_9RHOB|nr:phosphate ABC transporter substrate-binding/OmpA family protein [Celeribacter persicus]PTQ69739.1 phosphate ABC transporter substrate-binding protein (PhoT family) [Celeribacter persicus]
MLKFAALGLLACFSLTRPAVAQDVNLLSRDGSIAISGMFLSFDGEFYRVDTDLGVLTVDSSGVRCEGPGCPDLDGYYAQVRMSGDAQGMHTLLPALVTAFAMRNGYTVATSTPEAGLTSIVLSDVENDLIVGEFLLSETSSSEGFADLVAENTDIVLSLHKVTPSEMVLAFDAGVGDLSDPLRARVVALDALIPVVSRSNRIGRLSLADLAGIFTGNITNWQELGGGDAPVVPHLMRDDLREGSEFRRLILGHGVDVPEGLVKLHDSYDSLVSAVEQDPYAIGLGRMSEGGAVKALGLSGACGFEAEAAPADIKTEDYPLTRPVFLYTPAHRLPVLAREFLAFARSPAAQIVVARTDFVDQGVDELFFRDQGRRFANAITHAGEEVTLKDLQDVTRSLQGAKRLTLGFRFEGGSTTLDAQSRSNVHLLAELLEAGVFEGRSLIFAGFSDGQGAADVNRTLSKRRAETVLRAVRQALGEAYEPERMLMVAEGYGEAMPLACDDIGWGRSLNRRVEVWVRDQR